MIFLRVLHILLLSIFCASATANPVKAHTTLKAMIAHKHAKLWSALTGKAMKEAWVNPLDEVRRAKLQHTLNGLASKMEVLGKQAEQGNIAPADLKWMNDQLDQAMGEPEATAPGDSIVAPESETISEGFAAPVNVILPAAPTTSALGDVPSPVLSTTGETARSISSAPSADQAYAVADENEEISAEDMSKLAGVLLADREAHSAQPRAEMRAEVREEPARKPKEISPSYARGSTEPLTRTSSAGATSLRKNEFTGDNLAGALVAPMGEDSSINVARAKRRAFFRRALAKLGPSGEAVAAAAANPGDNLGDLLLVFLPLLLLSAIALVGLWRLRRQLDREVKGIT